MMMNLLKLLQTLLSTFRRSTPSTTMKEIPPPQTQSSADTVPTSTQSGGEPMGDGISMFYEPDPAPPQTSEEQRLIDTLRYKEWLPSRGQVLLVSIRGIAPLGTNSFDDRAGTVYRDHTGELYVRLYDSQAGRHRRSLPRILHRRHDTWRPPWQTRPAQPGANPHHLQPIPI